MIIFHLKDLMIRKAAKEEKKITYADISKAIKVSPMTLSRVASKTGHNAKVNLIEKLCLYFDCTPNDLMTIVPDSGDNTEKEE